MYQERASRHEGAVVWTRTARRPHDPPYPVLPDGCMDLLWMDDRLYVAGPDLHAYVPEAPGDGTVAGLRFAPGTAYPVLGVPARELRDRRVALAELWPAAQVRRLTARVAAAGDPATALESLVLDRAADSAPADPLPRLIAERLASGHGVAATADALGVGARRLHRSSLDAFGYGPKTLARILRLQRALTLARTGLPFAETAAVAGFADQAHLARDVRDLAGMPLGRLLTLEP
ncbi:helix-turn-helix domain-containing protein [Streptomyces triticagri]|uniref:Helix-turn-helix domain-containing protein n=1 Tax=Streptomyces triticagri TaxID=2293568 RepID=A0A372M2B6_9ACTN|nr:helix-turn-helix domain-containing protein [Streptomyces triticagri]RFU85031.1 helix-turn-helix domain-containing protein [Streptomyces triticagri]